MPQNTSPRLEEAPVSDDALREFPAYVSPVVRQILESASDIKRIFDTNASRQANIARAIEIISKKSKDRSVIMASVRSIIDAVVKNELRIFLSYKSAYQGQVEAISKILSDHSNNIKCYGARHISPGDDWRQYIDEKTTLANWFILFYGDPDIDWGWCLYECGLFEKKKYLGERDFCLYPEHQQPPEQLKHLQDLPVSSQGIKTYWRLFI